MGANNSMKNPAPKGGVSNVCCWYAASGGECTQRDSNSSVPVLGMSAHGTKAHATDHHGRLKVLRRL